MDKNIESFIRHLPHSHIDNASLVVAPGLDYKYHKLSIAKHCNRSSDFRVIGILMSVIIAIAIF